MKMIIDTDPGIDDAMAILYAALDPQIELLGLTSIFGNVDTQTATRNALRLAELAGLNIPVAEGANTALHLPKNNPPAHIHGREGFGDIPAAAPKGKAVDETAAEFLSRMAEEHKGELVVCPIGPITNIAEVILADAEFAKNVDRIVLMGAAVTVPGNVTEFAEANTYHDPHALNVVLSSGADVVTVGLDVTTRIRCGDDDFQSLAKTSPKIGGFLSEAARYYIDFHEEVVGERICNLHDPAAIIACTHPELFKMNEMKLSTVEAGERIGQTSQDSEGNVAKVCVDCDADAIKDRFLGIFSQQT